MTGQSISGIEEEIKNQTPQSLKFFVYECVSVEKTDSSIHGVQTTQKPPEKNKFESLPHTLHLCKLHLDQKFKHILSKDIKVLSEDFREIFK